MNSNHDSVDIVESTTGGFASVRKRVRVVVYMSRDTAQAPRAVRSIAQLSMPWRIEFDELIIRSASSDGGDPGMPVVFIVHFCDRDTGWTSKFLNTGPDPRSS